MKKLLLILVGLVVLFNQVSNASHLMGGEITWQCIKSGANAGRYIFTVKLYRDCNGVPGPPSVQLTSNAPGLGGGINCNLISQNDLSPQGPGCPTCAAPLGLPNAVEEFVYQSGATLIAGVPPATGWFFAYTNCCRNAAITNLVNPGSGDFALRAFMFPYNGTNTNPCFDSSPRFAERPQLSTCTRNPTTYNHNAIDEELDSLVYDWGIPLNLGFPGSPFQFSGGYTATSPLPGPTQNAQNVAAVMDPNTGAVNFTSYTPGVFVTVTKVTAYKCQIKVAEVYREIQIALLGNCNIPDPTTGGQTWNTPPIVNDLLGNSLTDTLIEVVAGDTVEIPIVAFDFQWNQPTGQPLQGQRIGFFASGAQFGNNFTDPNNGCPFPPCAVFSPAPPPAFTAQSNQATFRWVTDCNHLPQSLGCVNLSNIYNFVIKVFDNNCPSPAVNFNTISIKVNAPPPCGAPRPKCLDVQDNGTVRVTFLPPKDLGIVDTNKYFKAFYIYRSTTGAAGPYTLLDSLKGFSIANYDTVLTYTDLGVNANTGPVHYYLATSSGCGLLPPTISDTLSTIYLTVAQVGTNAALTWTPFDTPLPASTTRVYQIYRESLPPGSGVWNLIGTTANLSYNDPVNVCASLVNYRIHVVDTSAANCVSRSNIDGAFLTSALPPIFSPTLLTTAVLPNGDVQICWKESQDTAQYFDKTYIYHSTSPAGPFTKIDSVSTYNLSLYNSYTHVGANANAGIHYYFLTLTAGCDAFNLIETVATPSDTLATMLLSLNNATVGSAILNWNPVSVPLPPGSSGTYSIYRRIPPGAWALVGNTPNLTYTDPISLCDTLIQYRVEMTNAQTTCVNVSSVDQDVFTSLGDIIDNPEPRCLAVQTNGDVIITWSPAADPTNFFAGTEIYSATTPAGPYSLLTTLTNAATTSWTHAGANANNQIVYYYLRSLSGCDGTRTNGSTSDTLASMRLTVSNATLGSAILNWNAMHIPQLGSVSGPYRVMRRSTGVGAYVQIGTTNSTTYSDPITNCNVPYEYRIELDDNLPCTSISSAENGLFSWVGNVVTNPDLRCVNVLPSGAIELTWIAPVGSTTDFNEYEIFRNGGAGFTLIDSVSVFNQLTFVDNTANGNAQSYSYYLRSQSGCTGQVNSPANSATVSSIYLTTTPSLGQATLNWNGMPLLPTSPASGYDVWSSYPNGNTLSVIGSTTSLTYQEPINDCDTTLQHRISVTDASGCISNSNVDVNNFTYIGNVINNPDLRCVSVLPSGAIELTWIAPGGSSANFNEYEIYRNNGAGFTLLDSVGAFNQLTYIDNTANGNAQAYSYYLLSQSGCSGQVNSAANSATVSSIYLTSTATLGQATLNWTGMPLQPSAPASGYDVWSSYPNGNTLSVIGSTTSLSYQEAITDCDTTLQHRISVTDASGCISNSNVDVNNFTYYGNLIPHPELRCASVSPNGQVQLTWVNPAPASWINFNQYNVYRNTGAGFTLVDSVENFATSTYLDAGANANAGSVLYYLQTKSGCSGQIDPSVTGGAANGNTLQTIYLSVSGANTTTATLNWNAVSSPLLPTSAAVYTIERQQPANTGVWTVAASNVAATNWQENLILCIDSVRYRVSIADAAGCTSLSNVDIEEFVDHTIPDAPSPRCVSVQPNGQVTINWIAPADTGQRFGMYTIYRGNSPSGPFLPVTTINSYSTLSTLDNTVNAQAASYSYIITTKTACGGEESPNSDTLQTIKVTVANNNGVAVITWNPIHNPELPTANQTYKVFKEYPAGNWSQIGTTVSPTYLWTDTINLCEAIINYRVETGDQSGCVSVSSTDGDLFRDVTRPVVSSLDSVSLDPFNPSNVSVSWLPSPSGDVVGYIIYQFNGASWDSIGAVQGINGSYFLHNNPAAEFASQRYSIAAYDSCGNVSNIGTSHNTLFTTGKLDVCRGAIDLRWNPYINMVNGVAQYQIFMSENGGPYTLLASVPGNNVTYSHTGLNDETNYCYYIQAVGNTVTRTSRSNIVCVYADLLELPTFSYLKRATVLDSRRVLVEAWVDVANNPDVSRYKLQRAFDPNGPFVTVNAAVYTGQPLVTFIDNGAKTNQYSYYYRVITIDSCGNEVLISNLGRTILLTGQPEFNLVNELSWNFYEDWLGDVANYALFRSVDGVWDPAPLATLNNGVLEYNDDVSALYKFPTYKGKFCYRVEAYEGPGNTYGFTDTSISNEFCLIQEPHVFVPNGFTPGGKNSVFRPEFIYVDIKNYYFAVLNRWGQKVYETRTPGEGWDGTYNGSIAPEGTYAYTVRIFGTNGQEIEKIGTVTLLR